MLIEGSCPPAVTCWGTKHPYIASNCPHPGCTNCRDPFCRIRTYHPNNISLMLGLADSVPVLVESVKVTVVLVKEMGMAMVKAKEQVHPQMSVANCQYKLDSCCNALHRCHTTPHPSNSCPVQTSIPSRKPCLCPRPSTSHSIGDCRDPWS